MIIETDKIKKLRQKLDSEIEKEKEKQSDLKNKSFDSLIALFSSNQELYTVIKNSTIKEPQKKYILSFFDTIKQDRL